ncbi:uncharacterized protein LOC124131384 isoform X2 [Haliotis rufescens]|uniref:uncharacterized protein LOC124131384 isoform X2 n=1 Tax=Haliotis rufescens TaxID=6454 RepID=UPI001EB0A8C1|nr:uncharacterized protein LOC124131384 isoform X2 [Haliotis rufescens]
MDGGAEPPRVPRSDFLNKIKVKLGGRGNTLQYGRKNQMVISGSAAGAQGADIPDVDLSDTDEPLTNRERWRGCDGPELDLGGIQNKIQISEENTLVETGSLDNREVPMEQEPSPPHHGMEPTVTAVQASSALDIDADPEGFESLTLPISRPQRNPSTPSNTLNARFQTNVKSAYVPDHGSLVIDGVESRTPLHSFSEDQSPCHDGPSLIDLSKTRKVKSPPDAGESGGGASDFSAALSGNERVTSPIPLPEHRKSQRGHLQNVPPSAADQQHEQTFTRVERGSATRNGGHMEQAQQCLHFREVQGRDYYTIDHCCHVVDIRRRSDVFGDVSQGTGILLSWSWNATKKHVVYTSWTVALAADRHRDRSAIINQLVHGKFLSLRNLASDIFRSYTAHLVSVTTDLSFTFGHLEEQSANRMIECNGDVHTVISGYLPMDCKFNLQVLKDASYEVSRDASPEECQPDVPADIQGLSEAIQKKMNLSTESREESKEMAEVQAKLANMESEFKQVESTFRQILKNQKDNSERQLLQPRNDMSNSIGLMKQQPSQIGATQDRVPVDVREIQEKERGFHPSTVSSRHDSTYSTGETKPNELDPKSQQADNMQVMATSNSPAETGRIDIGFMDKFESFQRRPDPTPVNQVSQGSPTVPHSTDMPRDTNLKDDARNNHLSQHLPTKKSSRQDVNDLVHILPEESLVSAERLLEAFSVSSVGDRRSHPEVKRLAESIALALQEERPPPSRSKGPDTILCLDVSDSIAQHGLEQLKKAANSFIDGIEDIAEQFGLEENLGVVAMGGRSTVVQELTNDFGLVRDAIDNLEVGGRSPLFEALLVCAAALKGRGGILSIGDAHKIRPRLIVVTDGLATSYARWTGSDGGSSDHDTKVKLIQLVQQFTPKNNSSAPNPIVWVPVGKADTGFLKSLAKLGQGELVEGEDMARLCKNYRIQGSIGKILLCIQSQHMAGSMSSSIETVAEALVGEMDPAEKSAVVEAVKRKLDHKDTDSDDDDDNIEPNDFKRLREKKALLALGTRVCRGPDWKWGDQDSGGPGTVVNHAKEDNLVWVCWDFNSTFCRYRYGYENNYDLLVQDTARYLCDDELIEIGNKVQRGRDWACGHQDGGPGSYGVVIRKAQDGKVKVRWIDADKIFTYNYGCDGRFDLEICKPDLETRPRKPSPVPAATKVHEWQWRDSTGKWRLYDAVTTGKLEKEFQRNAKGSCLIQRNGKSFRVVFKKDPMIEKLVSGNEVHDVRRQAVSDEERGQL